MKSDARTRFDAPLADWFAAQGWKPAPFQRDAWRRWRRGESGLLVTPTGSGKTLAALGGPLLDALADAARAKAANAKAAQSKAGKAAAKTKSASARSSRALSARASKAQPQHVIQAPATKTLHLPASVIPGEAGNLETPVRKISRSARNDKLGTSAS